MFAFAFALGAASATPSSVASSSARRAPRASSSSSASLRSTAMTSSSSSSRDLLRLGRGRSSSSSSSSSRRGASVATRAKAPFPVGVPDANGIVPGVGKGMPKWPEVWSWLNDEKRMQTIDSREAVKMMKRGAVLLDVRFEPDYEKWSVPGSVHVPYVTGGVLAKMRLPGFKKKNVDFVSQVEVRGGRRRLRADTHSFISTQHIHVVFLSRVTYLLCGPHAATSSNIASLTNPIASRARSVQPPSSSGGGAG